MTALTFVPGLGRAAGCECVENHRPKPARFVWHHKLPRACGGTTTPANLIALCDNAHYAVHDLLWELATHAGELPPARGRRNEYLIALARDGYTAAVAAGTADRIPRED